MHSIIELACATLCVACAVLSYVRYKRTGVGLLLIWAAAFGFVAIADASQALFSVTDFGSAMVAAWLPWTWALGRFILASFLLLGLIWSQTGIPKRWWLWCLGYISVVVIVMSLPVSWSSVLSVDFVQRDGAVKRPLDLLLTLVWATLAIVFVYTRTASLYAPKGFEWYLFVGVVIHAIMAFTSAESLDISFKIAHALKLLEYAMWLLGSLLIELDYRRYGHDVGCKERARASDPHAIAEVCERANRRAA